MSSEQEGPNSSSDYPDWFQKWLDDFKQATGMQDLPDYKAAYYPDWYRQAYPAMSTYGRNLWWESAAIPYSFMPSYTWSAISREASQGYYQAQANRYVSPTNLLGQASRAYYQQQLETTPWYLAYQISKIGSYAVPGMGLYRGFAFAPTGFAWDVITGQAQAPYIRELAQTMGPAYANARLQNYSTLFAFQEPTTANLIASGLEWGVGQSALFLTRPFLTGTARALLAGEGIYDALRLGVSAFRGVAGAMGGVGFGLAQYGVQVGFEELAYVYNMGQAGLGSQLYNTPERAARGVERWSLAFGGTAAGIGLGAASAAYGSAMSASAALGGGTLSGLVAGGAWGAAGSAGLAAAAPAALFLAGVLALSAQVTSDVLARQQFNIPWYEPLTYTRSRAFGGEFQINPRMVSPQVDYAAALASGKGGPEAAFGLYGQNFSALNYAPSSRYVPPGYVYDPQGRVVPNPSISGSPWTRLYGTYPGGAYGTLASVIPPSSPNWWVQQMQIQSGNVFWEQRKGLDAWWAWQHGNVYPNQGAYLDWGALPTVAEYNRYWSQPQGVSSWLGPGGGLYSPTELMMNYYNPQAPTSFWDKYYSLPGETKLVRQYVFENGTWVFSGTSELKRVLYPDVSKNVWSKFNALTRSAYFDTGYTITGTHAGVPYTLTFPGRGEVGPGQPGTGPVPFEIQYGLTPSMMETARIQYVEGGAWITPIGSSTSTWVPGYYGGGDRFHLGGHGTAKRVTWTPWVPWTHEEEVAKLQGYVKEYNYLYYPWMKSWAAELGVELAKSPEGRYGEWWGGYYREGKDPWDYYMGRYARAAMPTLEDMASQVDSEMIEDEVMWLAANTDLAEVIGQAFYRTGRESSS